MYDNKYIETRKYTLCTYTIIHKCSELLYRKKNLTAVIVSLSVSKNFEVDISTISIIIDKPKSSEYYLASSLASFRDVHARIAYLSYGAGLYYASQCVFIYGLFFFCNKNPKGDSSRDYSVFFFFF